MQKWELEEKLLEYRQSIIEDEKAIKSRSKYMREAEAVVNCFDGKDLTKEDVIALKQGYLFQGLKASTINNKIICINRFLKFCGLDDLKVKLLKTQKTKSLKEILSIADYKRLLRHAKAMHDDEIYMIMKVLAETGIRISELHYFTVENLSYYIEVRNKGKNRTIIIRQDLLRELKKYCREHHIKCGSVFANKDTGKMIHETTIRKRMKKVAAHAHVDKSLVHPHMFRHLFAVLYLDQNNNNVLELADLLGHESLETTRIYTRTTDDIKRKKLEKMKY